MSAAFPTSAQHAAPGDKGVRAQSPVQRLTESRERLRSYMMRSDSRLEARRRAAAARAEGTSPSPLDRLRSIPVVGVLIDVVSAWWSNHPLHSAATMAEAVARDTIAPIARRHPIAIVAAAFFAGAAIARFKPWRRIGASALFAGFASQVVSRVLTQMPWESLLGAFTTFAQFRTPPASDATEAPSAGTGSASSAVPTPQSEAVH
jgi:hypothetical protein